jgi:hypothetical protein
MAEFHNTEAQIEQRAADAHTADGMDAFGKPVPYFRREAGQQHCQQMGLTDTGQIMGMIDRMAEAIRRDKPYEAMEAGTTYLDLTGAYRLLAVLCCEPAPEA